MIKLVIKMNDLTKKLTEESIEAIPKSWEMDRLKNAIVDRVSKKIIESETGHGEQGHYDRFKNQVAQLVADKIYRDICNDDEIKRRIELACVNAEKTTKRRMDKAVTVEICAATNVPCSYCQPVCDHRVIGIAKN